MKQKTHLLTLVFCLAGFTLIFLHSCGGGQKTSSLEYSENTTQTQTGTVTYAQIKKEILDPHCISCHANVATEQGLMQWITPGNPEASPFFTTVENGSMPKNAPPLSTKDLELIRAYITQMSPATTASTSSSSAASTSGGGTSTGGTPAGITYQQFRTNVLVPFRCVNCHAVGSEASLARWINTSNPAASPLYTTMKSGSMPKGGPRADAATLQYTLQYINDFIARQGQ